MISVNQLSVLFGDFILFDNVSFLVNERDRIGLAGKNGAGKSTLLKIFAKLQQPTSGGISYPSDIKIGYLPQHMLYNDGKTLMEDALTAFDEVLNMKAEIDRLNNEVATREDYESEEYIDIVQKLTDTSERFHMLGGDNIEGEAEKTLMGLGFQRSDFQRQTSEFSGGWRMRIELAKILLKRPDIFLLDEPTNHLDIESIQWLEDFLKTYSGAVILVSHDKAFLDNVTNRTVEISLGKIYDYKVNYTKYVELRKERREQQKKAFENQQKMIKDTEDFIERFRYKATKSVQVQSRIKQLAKVDRIEIDDEDVRSMNIRFAPAKRSGDIVASGSELTKRFGDHVVLDSVNFEIHRGDKLAFIGKNGEGKTTLVRMIMGMLDYEGGECNVGHNVNIGYFAQNQAQMLDDNKTVFEVVDDIAVGDIRLKLKSILAAFMFAGEELDKKVKVLSGGERSRLAMVRLMLEPYNVLILDEPTNHLDIRSKDILKAALANFDGTVIVVSHDRDFLDGLVNKMYEFGNKQLKEHSGGIYEFLAKKRLTSLNELEIKQKEVKVKSDEAPSANKLDYQERKELNKKIKKVQNGVDKAEQNITKCEELIAQMDEQFANPNGTEDEAFYAKYEQTKKDLEQEMENWETFSFELDELIQQRD